MSRESHVYAAGVASHSAPDRGRADAPLPERTAAYSGMFPCLRFGRGSRFVSVVSSASISTGRVRRGSITSST